MISIHAWLSLVSMHDFFARFCMQDFCKMPSIYVDVIERLAVLAYNKLSYFDSERKLLNESNSIYRSQKSKKLKKLILPSFCLKQNFKHYSSIINIGFIGRPRNDFLQDNSRIMLTYMRRLYNT